MKTTRQVTACVAAAVAVGTAYVLVHESRRKAKKAARLAAGEASSSSEGLNAERLIFVLGESARGAYQLIEQTRRIVHEKHVQTGQPLETCVDELQKDFEAASACQPRALLPFCGIGAPAGTSASTAVRGSMAIENPGVISTFPCNSHPPVFAVLLACPQWRL